MGQYLVKLADPRNVTRILSTNRKRKRSSDNDADDKNKQNDDEESPKKKKLMTSSQYIYKALFMEQCNTDISVMALGRLWNLHKVYLSQSPYFFSMFNGSWKEANEDFIHIKILDEKITIDALDAVFGSLYSDEIVIDESNVISILAVGTLFHLEGIIGKCCEVMEENIDCKTVLSYYEAANEYGCVNVRKEAFKWLEIRLLTLHTHKFIYTIRDINVELMTELVKSPNLFVIQTEYSLYNLLRIWIYAKLHPNFPESQPNQINGTQADAPEALKLSSAEAALVNNFFTKRTNQTIPFLYTSIGREFLKPFLALRTQYLINHCTDTQIILKDNIIPKEWIKHHAFHHWDQILKIDHVLDEDGPQSIDPETFNKCSMRCGRILTEPGYQKWRWTGFNFGIDLIFILTSKTLCIRRHHRPENERLLSFKTNRNLMIRATVTGTMSDGKLSGVTQSSGILSLNLAKNAETTLMVIDQKLTPPLLLSVNMLLESPAPDFKADLVPSEESCLNLSAIPISNIGADSNSSHEGNNDPVPPRENFNETQSPSPRKSSCPNRSLDESHSLQISSSGAIPFSPEENEGSGF